MTINVSGLVSTLLSTGMSLKEFVHSTTQIEHFSGKKVDFRLVVDLLAGMGTRLVIGGDTILTAPLLSSVHSNIPPHLSDDAFTHIPYAKRRVDGVYGLLPAHAEAHLPVKLDAWLRVNEKTWFPVILFRDMVSVAELNTHTLWCSRFYCTVNLPVIDYTLEVPALRILRVNAPTAAAIYATQSITFTLTDVNKGMERSNWSKNRHIAAAVETPDDNCTENLYLSYAWIFEGLAASFTNQSGLGIGEAIRLRKIIHYTNQDLQGVQASMLSWEAAAEPSAKQNQHVQTTNS